MQEGYKQRGSKELRNARKRSRKMYWTVAFFSFFCNLLMLTGPVYMLQVYDRVLGSGSIETLIALSTIMLFMYAVMGVLDYVRGRIMAGVGAQFQSDLDQRVFEAVIRKSADTPSIKTRSGLADVEAIQRLMSSPVLLAAFDLPWAPIFFFGIFLFHPVLGYLALGGAAALVLITFANQILSREHQADATNTARAANLVSEQISAKAEMVQAMGMRDAAFERWLKIRNDALGKQTELTSVTRGFSSLSKTFRLFLQSAMLGMGAWLVLQSEMTPGAMIAGTILLGRALAPVDLALNQWGVVQRAIRAWSNLSELLGSVPEEEERVSLPTPAAKISAQSISVYPPGEKQPVLKSISFEVLPGQALGIVGPSGSGKSSLARSLIGVWQPMTGSIHLGGARLDQYSSTILGKHVGYLPQNVDLFDGTIAENIARLDPSMTSEKVIAAAKLAAAHDMIIELPNGYDTKVSAQQTRLSGGQVQRIGLARALYNEPVAVILDEPDSNLDSAGSQALNMAIRELKAKQRAVIVIAHRPTAVQECDVLLVLENGSIAASGPKEKIMQLGASKRRKPALRSDTKQRDVA